MAYEVSHIVQDGLRRMYGSTEEHPDGENVIFYLTVYNEPLRAAQGARGPRRRGAAPGALPGRRRPESAPEGAPQVQLLASGVGFPWITEAAQLLAEDWGVAAETWSVTSWNELARDGVAAEEWNFLHPSEEPRTPYVTDEAGGRRRTRSSRSATSCARCPNQIAKWVPGDYHVAGHRRVRLRRHPRRPPGGSSTSTPSRSSSRRSPRWPERGEVKREVVQEAFDKYRIDDPTAVAGVKQEGGDA